MRETRTSEGWRCGSNHEHCLPWRAAVFVLVLALILRIGWAALVPVVPVSDGLAYDTFAQHLAAGDAYGWDGQTKTAYWAVGTAFIYSVVYRLWHPEVLGYGGAIAINIAAGLAVVLLGMLLAQRWFGRRVAIASGVILALWPVHVQFTTLLASELFFTALMLGGILAWPKRISAQRLLLAGVLFAAAAYVRPTGLLVPAVLAGAAVLKNGDLRSAVVRWTATTAIMLAAIVPWSLRNLDAFGTPVLISTNSGANLWMGNSPGTSGDYRELPERPAEMTEAEFDAMLKEEAMAYIRERPVAFIARTAVKGVRFHERQTIGVVWNEEGLEQVLHERWVDPMKWVSQAYWMSVLALAFAGLWVVFRCRGIWAMLTHPAVLIWGYFIAVHAIIVFQDRYHFPVTPFIGMLAAAGLLALREGYHLRRGGTRQW